MGIGATMTGWENFMLGLSVVVFIKNAGCWIDGRPVFGIEEEVGQEEFDREGFILPVESSSSFLESSSSSTANVSDW